MDKETLSNYGWVVIVVIIICILLGIATPFGNFIADTTMDSLDALRYKLYDSLDIDIPIDDTPQYFTVTSEGVLGIKPEYQKLSDEQISVINGAKDNNVSIEEYLRFIIYNDLVCGDGEYEDVSQEQLDTIFRTYIKELAVNNFNLEESDLVDYTTARDAIYTKYLGGVLEAGTHATEQDVLNICNSYVKASDNYKQIMQMYTGSGIVDVDEFLSNAGVTRDCGYYTELYNILIDNIGVGEYTYVLSDNGGYGATYTAVCSDANFDDVFKACSGGYTWAEYLEQYPSEIKELPTVLGIPDEIDGVAIKSIPVHLFNEYNITRLKICGNIKTIDSGCFSNNESIKEIVLCSGTEVIDNDSFSNTVLEKINIPDTVKTIGINAFKSCEMLKSVKFSASSSLTAINDSAFRNCKSLTNIVIPETINSLGCSVFSSCENLTNANLSSNLLTLPDAIFQGCSSLKNVVLPNNITSIGTSAFSDCSSLTSINIPSGVLTINNFAFDYCNNLREIIIPDTTTTIGKLAFSNCTGLNTITIGKGVSTIYNNAFSGCDNVSLINFNAINASVYETTNPLLKIGCDADNLTIVIGNDVETINAGIFRNINMTKVILGKGIKSIDFYTFNGADSLRELVIADGTTEIPFFSIGVCNHLTTVTIPASVTDLSNSEMFDYTSVTTIRGTAGSAAETFAAAHGYTFVEI